jgi:hypothetical protein
MSTHGIVCATRAKRQAPKGLNTASVRLGFSVFRFYTSDAVLKTWRLCSRIIVVCSKYGAQVNGLGKHSGENNPVFLPALALETARDLSQVVGLFPYWRRSL